MTRGGDQREFTATRYALRDAGFAPIPLYGKAPPIYGRNNSKKGLGGWQNLQHVDDQQIEMYEKIWPDAVNTGILTRNTPALDIDIKHQEAAEAVEVLVRERFGENGGRILVRIGLAPKRAILLRTNKPFKKITANFIAPDDSLHKIEVLGEGQQLAVDGIHPDTGRPYAWFGGKPGEVKYLELPEVTEVEMIAFVAHATNLLIEQFNFKCTDATKGNGAVQKTNHPDPFAKYTATTSNREKAWATAALQGVAGELSATEPGNRNDKLYKCAFRMGTMITRNWIVRDVVEQELFSAAEVCGLVKDDGRKAALATIRSGIEGGLKHLHPDLVDPVKRPVIEFFKPKEKLLLSSADFVAGFIPPDYLINGLLQRCYIYSFTGPTGSGKTCLALRIGAHVALGLPLANLEVERGRVLFFAGENPDDVRTRWIKLCEDMEQDPDAMEVFFLASTPPLSNQIIRDQIEKEATKHGPFSLLIIDTSAAYFEGDNENDNVQAGDHARMLRTLKDLPGGPTVLVTCHPAKNYDLNNLLPRGGGAFLNEVDGNLVCIKQVDATVVEVTWHGKFRGPEFAPLSFELTVGTSDRLVDRKGRHIKTITAAPISSEEVGALESQSHERLNELLLLVNEHPSYSLTELAQSMGVSFDDGQPNKQKVQRWMTTLGKEKLVDKRRGRWKLTTKGNKEVEALEGGKS